MTMIMLPLRSNIISPGSRYLFSVRSFVLTPKWEGKGQRKPGKVLQKAGAFLDRKVSGNTHSHRKSQWYGTPLGISALTHIGASKKGPSKGTQRRSHQLSVVMTHYVTSLIYNGEMDERLVDMDVKIVKVKMATDLSALLVYWMGSGGKQDEVIAEILQEVSYKMRRALCGLHLLGSVPPVVFIKDLSAARLQKVQDLLNIADMGPDHEPTELGEEMKSDITLPRPEETLQDRIDKVSMKFANLELSSCVEGVTQSITNIKVGHTNLNTDDPITENLLSDINVTLRSDIYDLDHASLTKQVIDNKRRVGGIGAVESPSAVLAFQGMANKKFSKDELRKLLNKRTSSKERRPNSGKYLSSKFHQAEIEGSDEYDNYGEDFQEDDIEVPEYEYRDETKS